MYISRFTFTLSKGCSVLLKSSTHLQIGESLHVHTLNDNHNAAAYTFVIWACVSQWHYNASIRMQDGKLALNIAQISLRYADIHNWYLGAPQGAQDPDPMQISLDLWHICLLRLCAICPFGFQSILASAGFLRVLRFSLLHLKLDFLDKSVSTPHIEASPEFNAFALLGFARFPAESNK